MKTCSLSLVPSARASIAGGLRKVQLRRETIRQLTSQQLVEIGGGVVCVANETMHTQISLVELESPAFDLRGPTTCAR